MPSATKRRKVIATKGAASNIKPLDAFTTVSKPSSITKVIIDKTDLLHLDATTSDESSTANRKRKIELEEEGSANIPPAVVARTIQNRELKPLPQRRALEPLPPPPDITANSFVSPDTPTKGSGSLLDRLHLSTKNSTRSPNVSTNSPLQATDLPTELLDLINLHAAFLTALSLHYAHNGTHTPADLRLLCPDVARAWGKRKIVLEDIRRTLGIMNLALGERNNIGPTSKLSLSDYGHGKTCIEIRTAEGKAGRLARPVNENLMNQTFVRGLTRLWVARKLVDTELKDFIEGLPLEGITTCSSLAKMSPLLAKGQRRLEDMRAGITVKKEAAVRLKAVATGNQSETKLTLLERLRAKQLEQSNKAPPPTKAEIGRQAALQRIDEVISVLNILSTSSSIGQSRISFTMPTVLGKLRDSFKTPMSKEEGDTCVRLLASEIAPEWVKIVKMGKIEALAVNRDEKPTDLEIQKRVGSTA